jgi:hypothetical protein
MLKHIHGLQLQNKKKRPGSLLDLHFVDYFIFNSYLYYLLNSFVNWNIANSKSYIALYTGNSLYCVMQNKKRPLFRK